MQKHRLIVDTRRANLGESVRGILPARKLIFAQKVTDFSSINDQMIGGAVDIFHDHAERVSEPRARARVGEYLLFERATRGEGGKLISRHNGGINHSWRAPRMTEGRVCGDVRIDS